MKYLRLGINVFVVRGKFVFNSSTFKPVNKNQEYKKAAKNNKAGH
jgi:hypothetical protein